MIASHRIRLDPNADQKAWLDRAFGTVRFAYNWGIVEWNAQYEAHLQTGSAKPSEYSVRNRLTAIKRDEFPWMLETTKHAPESAIGQLARAWNAFFRDLKKKSTRKSKPPRFKKKGRCSESFSFGGNLSQFDEYAVRIPKLGFVKAFESLRFKGNVLVVTISRKAGKYSASVVVETDIHRLPVTTNDAVGVDLGITTLATIADGDGVRKVVGPRATIVSQRKMRRLSKSLSRKKTFSKNWTKAKSRISRLHERIANVRNDALHKLTSKLTATYRTIVIEDLNVAGMVRNSHLAKHVHDAAFGEFRRQLAYKCEWYGNTLVIANRFFPSSKTCSVCNGKNDKLELGITVWICDGCHTVHDRDANAAINLRKLAAGDAERINAHGETSAGIDRKIDAKLDSTKWESKNTLARPA